MSSDDPFTAIRTGLRYGGTLLVVFLLSACATPRVQPEGDLRVEARLENDHALMDDGYRLPLRVWAPRGDSRAVVLAVHGMNDYSNAFRSTGTQLAAHGITVLAWDQRGFGASEGAGYWHGHRRLAEDLRLMCRLVHKRYPHQPLYLLGESMGGATILASLAERPPAVDGIILSAPAVWSRSSMPWYQRTLLWLGAHTMPGKKLTGEGLHIMASDNIDMLRALGRDPLVIKATRIDTLYGVSNLMDAAFKASRQLHTDTLILYGANDEIIPRPALCRWLSALPPEPGRRRSILYTHGYHMLTRDLEGPMVVEDIAGWILGRAQPAGQRSDESLEAFCAGPPEREDSPSSPMRAHAEDRRPARCTGGCRPVQVPLETQNHHPPEASL